MAINSNTVVENKDPRSSFCSTSNASNLSSCRMIKINFSGKESCSSKRSIKVNNFKDIKSPYLTDDKVELLNRVTEKKLIHKKTNNMISSYPLAVSVYKANSDEFKVKKKACKKVKKSVLTLPHESTQTPKMCTVSDLNDSEYFNDNVNDKNKIRKTKKRRMIKRTKKPRRKDPEMEYFDRDARYCSQLNIDLDCSSSEVMNLNGNGEGVCRAFYKPNDSAAIENHPNDVWTVLRNLNKFQFRPSPPASHDSIVPSRKRKPFVKKGNNRNDTRIIETCHTEEFSYISSYEIDSKSQDSCSPSSSFDRITVIDKQSEQDIMKQFNEQIFKSRLNYRGPKKEGITKQIQKKTEPRLQNKNKQAFQGETKKDNKQNCPNITLNKTASVIKLGMENITTFTNNELALEGQETQVEMSDTFVKFENSFNSDKGYPKVEETLVTNQTNNLENTDKCAGNNSYNPKVIVKGPIARFQKSRTVGDSEQLNGITKVVLSKGQDIVPSRLEEAPRKPRPALMLPNNKIRKITQTEIKRHLANLKFPIVILGKDQLTNKGIDVVNCNPLQFNGLDQHIWPFMCDWFGERMQNIHDKKNEGALVKPKKCRINQDTDGPANYPIKEDANIKKYKRPLTNKNTHQYSNPTVPKCPTAINERPKPISVLKSKMFNFLHKLPYSTNITRNSWNKNQIRETSQTSRVDITGTEEKANENEPGYRTPIYSHSRYVTKTPDETKLLKKTNYSLKHPWAKAKWTSDFIENIIKKIRNGAYYGMNEKQVNFIINGTEVSTQTEVNVLKNASCQNGSKTDSAPPLALSKEDDPLKNIPGFDKTLSTLEIETISKSKIAVRHCVTNIVVQFDVQFMAEANNIVHAKNSLSCIPASQKNYQDKIFKCSTTIRNETLPADLCTIIPTMMCTLLNDDKNLCLPPLTVEKAETQLTPISECDSGPELILYSSHGIITSDQLRSMLTGRYTAGANLNSIVNSTSLRPSLYKINAITELFPTVDTRILWNFNKIPITPQIAQKIYGSQKIFEKSNENRNRLSNCTALQPYDPNKLALISSKGFFNINKFISELVNKLDINIGNSNFLRTTMYGQVYNSTVNNSIIIPLNKIQAVESFPPVNDIVVISLFKAFNKMTRHDDDNFVQNVNGVTQSNTEIQEKPTCISNNKSKLEINEGKKKKKPVKILNRKSYVKCYRKCNSMSSISTYKSIPLSKITNLDEFCQALGSNSISSVLGGCLEKKILEAVDELKNWITAISPKQALLVLLLTNKKYTPNFIRLRPLLLQGIAVNRITKADELDTEIEVIERENFNRLSQYEGIACIPASKLNQDILLEELYWIAKTTASDYQKTFDESSEKLLKSLLEKRKKLNPSYLRVMARYVGLGLLKPAKRKL